MMHEKELLAKDYKRLIVLAIYDIADTKKRLAMVKLLEKNAVRVQYSCFEGVLTPVQCEKMENEASKIIDLETDSLRIYILHNHAWVKTWGKNVAGNDNDEVIIY